MKRHFLDSSESIISLSGVISQGLFKDFLDGKLNLTTHFNNLNSLAERLDKKASEKYTGSELIDYAGRIKFCLEKLKEVQIYAKLQQENKLFSIPEAICILAYSIADLHGLEYTINYLDNGEASVA